MQFPSGWDFSIQAFIKVRKGCTAAGFVGVFWRGVL